MSKCSLCGRNVSNNNSHFGLSCLKNMCTLIGMEKVKNYKGETLLNNEIVKLTNKKSLTKDEKIILTNRYLTLQLLNNVPIKSYDNMRISIEKDIEKIGMTEKVSKENNIITLKQAYEAYKLYNKFQKIKNKK